MENVSVGVIVFNIAIHVALIAVVFSILYKVGWKPFLKYLATRQQQVQDLVIEAQQQKDEATKITIEAQEKIKEVHLQSDQLLAKAEETTQKMVEEYRINISKELEHKRHIAMQELEQERLRLEEKMQQRALDLASEIAQQFLLSKATKQTTQDQIEVFLEKLGDE